MIELKGKRIDADTKPVVGKNSRGFAHAAYDGRPVFLVLTGAFQFGQDLGMFTSGFIVDDGELLVRASAVLKSPIS